MKFPNAAEGVKKIYTGRLLGLILSICIIPYNAFSIFAKASGTDVSGSVKTLPTAIMFILSLVSIVLLVISVLSIVFEWKGLFMSGKDEISFKNAFFASIAGLAATIVFSVIIYVLQIGRLSCISNILTAIIAFVYYMFLFNGLRKLSTALSDNDMDRKGKAFFGVIVALIVFELIASITVLMLGGRDASVLSASVYLVRSILESVQAIIVLIYLAKAKNMLNEL